MNALTPSIRDTRGGFPTAFVALLTSLLAACHSAEAPPPSAPLAPAPDTAPGEPTSSPVAAATAPVVRSPEEYALDWVGFLRAKDLTSLGHASQYPFELRDTGSEGDCVGGTAATSAELPALVACLVEDTLLVEDLGANPRPLAESVPAGKLPTWATEWAGALPGGATPVHVIVPGNGNTFHFIVLATASGVQGFWKETTFDSD